MTFVGADTPGDGEDAFVIEFETDQEIRVKHRASGHVLCFDLTVDGAAIADLYRIDLNFPSSFDAETLVPSARLATIERLNRSRGQSD